MELERGLKKTKNFFEAVRCESGKVRLPLRVDLNSKVTLKWKENFKTFEKIFRRSCSSKNLTQKLLELEWKEKQSLSGLLECWGENFKGLFDYW